MPAALLPAVALVSFFSDPLGAFEELAFVIRIMSFVYILFWLFATFQDNQLLFGFTAMIAAYFVLFYSPIIIVLAGVVLLMVNGMFLQQSIMFGLFPTLGRDQMGNAVDYGHQEEMMRTQQLQQRHAAGEKLAQDEYEFLAQVNSRQQVADAQMQQFSPQGGGYGAMMQAGMRRR